MVDRMLSAELLIKARDATGQTFATIGEKFGLLDKRAKDSLGSLTGWGDKFQKELERLNVAPRYIDRTAQAWARLQRQWDGKGPPTGEWIAAQERWKNATLSQLRQVEAAQQRAAERHRRLGSMFGLIPGVGGAYGAYEVGRHAAHKIAEQDRERAREWLGAMTPAETAQATGAARDISARYPSVGPVAVMEHIRALRGRFGSFEHAMENVEELVKAQVVLQTLTGGESAGEDLEQLVLGIEGLGAGSNPAKFRSLLSAFVKAKSLFPDISGEKMRTYLQRSKASKYGLGDDYLFYTVPTMIQHEGENAFGTEQASAFSALVGLRQTRAAKEAMHKYHLLGKNDHIIDEAAFVENPRAWTQRYLRPQLEKKHLDLTDENRPRLIAEIQRMFSNRNVGEFFTSLLVNEPVLRKDKPMLEAAKDQNAAGELRSRDPFVAMRGLTEQIGAFAQIVGGPFGEKAAAVLNSITDAVARLSKVAGDDKDKANTIGEYGALGGGLAAVLFGRKLMRFGGRLLGPGGAPGPGGGRFGKLPSWLSAAAALLSLSGDTPGGGADDNPWGHSNMTRWKLPKDWDYTLNSDGTFRYRPPSNSPPFADLRQPVVPGLDDNRLVADPDRAARGLFYSGGASEVKGSADLNVGVTVQPSDDFVTRIVQAIRNDINVFRPMPAPGSGVGTAGSTGLSMPEVWPQP